MQIIRLPPGNLNELHVDHADQESTVVSTVDSALKYLQTVDHHKVGIDNLADVRKTFILRMYADVRKYVLCPPTFRAPLFAVSVRVAVRILRREQSKRKSNERPTHLLSSEDESSACCLVCARGMKQQQLSNSR